MNNHRHCLRLDDATQKALEEICRHRFATKSEVMRRYVQDGVRHDAKNYAEQALELKRAMEAIELM